MDAPAILAAIVVVVVLVVVARVLAPWRPDGRETTTSTIASMISHGIGSAQVSPPKVSRTPTSSMSVFGHALPNAQYVVVVGRSETATYGSVGVWEYGSVKRPHAHAPTLPHKAVRPQ